MPKYNVIVPLSVRTDGNAVAIMGRVATAIRKAGATSTEIDQYYNESMSGDYDNLLRVAAEWVQVK